MIQFLVKSKYNAVLSYHKVKLDKFCLKLEFPFKTLFSIDFYSFSFSFDQLENNCSFISLTNELSLQLKKYQNI